MIQVALEFNKPLLKHNFGNFEAIEDVQQIQNLLIKSFLLLIIPKQNKSNLSILLISIKLYI